jgi:hypothetical protein
MGCKMSKLAKNQSRRSFIKKAAYIAPAVLTLNALPAFASQGSVKRKGHNGPGTSPGNHGNNYSGFTAKNFRFKKRR